jgi:hypothetical protein
MATNFVSVLLQGVNCYKVAAFYFWDFVAGKMRCVCFSRQLEFVEQWN